MKIKVQTFLAALLLVAGAANAQTVNLSSVTNGASGTGWSFDGTVLTVTSGTITITGNVASGTNRRVVVTGNANITLDNLSINLTNNPGGSDRYANAATNCAFAITNSATVNLTLTNANMLASGHKAAGLNVPYGSTVNISGTGSLNASCLEWGGAGIGGNRDQAVGSININSGNITAAGKGGGAGVGGGTFRSGGNITISGGTVTAQGSYAAGIGGGEAGAGGVITISGGTITATAGAAAAGIGGGRSGAGGNITINGGSITANGSERGAGIGGGDSGANGGTIIITGGTVTATKGNLSNRGDIGPGNNGANGTVTITGGSVKCTTAQPVPQPTNGSSAVYLSTLTVGTVGNDVALTAANVNGQPYGVTDVKTDASGKVYFWLPAAASAEEVSLTANSTVYANSFTRAANSTAATLYQSYTATLTVNKDASAWATTGKTFHLHRGGTYKYSNTTGNSPLTFSSIDGGSYTVYDETTNTGVTVSNAQPDATVNYYTVTYDGNGSDGGSVPTDNTAYLSGASVTVSGNTGILTKSGYAFGGWTGDNGINAIQPAATFIMPAAATTLTAVWNQKTVTVGTQTATPVYGSGNNAEFDVTTANIADGTHSFTLTGAPTDVAVSGNITISGNSGTLTLSTNATTTPAGTPHSGLTVTIDGATSAAFTLTVSKKPLTVTGGVTATKVYDGTNSFAAADINTGSATYSGKVGADDVSLDKTSVTGTLASADVTTGATLTLGGIPFSLTGGKASNYTLSAQPTVSASITKRSLTVTAATIDPKTYDATTNATVASLTFSGLISQQTLTDVTDYTVSAAFDNANAGVNNRSVTVTVALENTQLANNYKFDGTDNEITLQNQTIAQAPLTFTATIDPKTYDATTNATVASLTFYGLQNNESLTDPADYTVSALFDNANAGVNNRSVTVTVALKNTQLANNYIFTGSNNQYTLSNQTIDKATGAAVSGVPTLNAKTWNTITVNAVTNSGSSGQPVEYAISTSLITLSDLTALNALLWQPATTFTPLPPITNHYVYARTASAANYYAGATQVSLAIETDPGVTGVTVSPATATVQKGTTQQFTATAQGHGTIPQTFAWSVRDASGNALTSGTAVNATGLLTVANSETLSAILVIATSTVDNFTADTALVALYVKAPTPGDGNMTVVTPPGGDPEDNGDGGITLPEGGTVTDPDDETEYVLPPNSTIDDDGTITVGGCTPGSGTPGAHGTATTPDGGSVDMSCGTQIDPDGDRNGHTVIRPDLGGATITDPDGNEIHVPGDGTVIIIDPSYPFNGGLRIVAPPAPPIIMRKVTLHIPDGIISQPAAGDYYIHTGSDFSFTITLPLNRTALPVVKTNHYDDIQKTLTGTSNANGSYTFTVRQIRQPLSITVAYPDVSNDAVASSDRIRSHNGRVYITPAQSGTIRIYNVTGIETFHATALRGETISTILPRGIYIVAVGGKTQKVVVR